MSPKLRGYDPAFMTLENWVKSLSTPALTCRARHGHKFSDWDDTEKTRAWKERRTGVVLLESDCEEGCGTFMRKVIGADGVIELGLTAKYDYADEYKLPVECREIPTRLIIAACRIEKLRRRGGHNFKLVDDLTELPGMGRLRNRRDKQAKADQQVKQAYDQAVVPFRHADRQAGIVK